MPERRQALNELFNHEWIEGKRKIAEEATAGPRGTTRYNGGFHFDGPLRVYAGTDPEHGEPRAIPATEADGKYVADFDPPTVLALDVETIAEAVHNAWWDQAKANGRHHPHECPHESLRERGNNCPDCHPNMVSYADLDDATKEYDRVTARAVLKAIRPHIDTQAAEIERLRQELREEKRQRSHAQSLADRMSDEARAWERQFGEVVERAKTLRREIEMLRDILSSAKKSLADLDRSFYRVVKKDADGFVMGSVSVRSLVKVVEAYRNAIERLESERGSVTSHTGG